MTAQPDLSLVAEMLRTPERFLDGSREEQANLCEQADNATGEARTVNRAVEGGLPPLPQAFFDEFGESADDRVQDYARDAIRLATPEQPGSAVRGEAVAWRDDHGNLYPCRESVDKYAKGRAVHPLYTTPPPAPTSVPDLDAVVVLLNHLEDLMDQGVLPEDAISTDMWNAASKATRSPAPAAEQGDAPAGWTVRFGNGSLIINTGSSGDEPAVFVDAAPRSGEVGASAPDVSTGTTPVLRLLFPTKEQAGRVADALVNAPSKPLADHHRWDDSGERCVKCGDKDWMGGPCNPTTQPEARGVEGMRPDFESWVAKRHGCALDRWNDTGKYLYDNTNAWWECWTAALSGVSAPEGKGAWPSEAKPAADGDGWCATTPNVLHRMAADQAQIWNACLSACKALHPAAPGAGVGCLLPRETLYAALQELIHRIEVCGASPELTNASSLACDLMDTVGNQYNAARPDAVERVTAALAGKDGAK